MTLVVVTIAAIGFVMVAMAIGVLVTGKCLSGSCGGPKVTGTNGELVCGTCGRHEKRDLPNVT